MSWVGKMMQFLYPENWLDWLVLVWIVVVVGLLLWSKKGIRDGD